MCIRDRRPNDGVDLELPHGPAQVREAAPPACGRPRLAWRPGHMEVQVGREGRPRAHIAAHHPAGQAMVGRGP
eukprot:674864-Alexandrium_andersonii.AAC.1